MWKFSWIQLQERRWREKKNPFFLCSGKNLWRNSWMNFRHLMPQRRGNFGDYLILFMWKFCWKAAGEETEEKIPFSFFLGKNLRRNRFVRTKFGVTKRGNFGKQIHRAWNATKSLNSYLKSNFFPGWRQFLFCFAAVGGDPRFHPLHGVCTSQKFGWFQTPAQTELVDPPEPPAHEREGKFPTKFPKIQRIMEFWSLEKTQGDHSVQALQAKIIWGFFFFPFRVEPSWFGTGSNPKKNPPISQIPTFWKNLIRIFAGGGHGKWNENLEIGNMI